MGKLVIEKWQCDRCGEVHDKRPSKDYYSVKVVFEIEEEWHTNTTSWKEVCPRCTSELVKLLPTLSYKKVLSEPPKNWLGLKTLEGYNG